MCVEGLPQSRRHDSGLLRLSKPVLESCCLCVLQHPVLVLYVWVYSSRLLSQVESLSVNTADFADRIAWAITNDETMTSVCQGGSYLGLSSLFGYPVSGGGMPYSSHSSIWGLPSIASPFSSFWLVLVLAGKQSLKRCIEIF